MNRCNIKIITSIFNRTNEIQAMRQNVCNRYNEAMNKFKDKVLSYKNKTFYRYPVIIKMGSLRDFIVKDLQNLGIGAFPLYPVPLNYQPGLKEILNDPSNYPNAEYISKNLFTLPVNEFVNEKVIIKVDKILNKYLN